jgi:hypothetical protein
LRRRSADLGQIHRTDERITVTAYHHLIASYGHLFDSSSESQKSRYRQSSGCG